MESERDPWWIRAGDLFFAPRFSPFYVFLLAIWSGVFYAVLIGWLR